MSLSQINSASPTNPAGKTAEKWDSILTAESPLIHLPLKEIWAYRDLIWLLVQRDVVSTYKQTVLGPLWFIIQPLVSTLIYTVIFGKIAKIPTDSLPPFLFYMSGIVLWNYFSACFTKCAGTFTANAGIFGKVYFPRLIMPISYTVTSLIQFGIQLGLFFVFYFYFLFKGTPIEPSYRIIVLPALILQCALLGVGCGCIVSALTTRYRDLQMAMGFGLQLWMYASCIFYPRSEVPEQYQWLMTLNPMVPIIESFRFAFMGIGEVRIPQLLGGIGISLFIFFAGLAVFSRTEKNFTDTI